ncbi:response regulator [Cyclobacterium plantarum]|uniref:Response regulator n=1 Tax=Cyclobacterium plantarum TaxID=2716263 RepID=A0ABX0HBR9_9BACT|nr:response regulator [Cyclobacterium plantarum]NHE59139.1 response regulator [Cyclobacterium plantarum]
MKVFLIDDQKITNVLNRKYLSMIREDLDIFDFDDPELAMDALEKEKPALIFLDLNMPIVSGWDILLFMRKRKIEIPVIILTSSSSQQDREKANLFHNVFSFQLKPLTKSGFTELLQGYYLLSEYKPT